jgi:hypothetical protein
MKYPQPAPGEDKNDPFFDQKGAEKAFTEFVKQVFQKQAQGFISEGENGQIFSFETYLRETGHESGVIAAYCQHAKDGNLLEITARKARKFRIIFGEGSLKGLLLLLGIVLAPVLLIYLLVATLLLIFNVSLWNGSAFLYFTSIGSVVMLGYLFLKPSKKGKAKNGKANTRSKHLYVIKYFDNDELTFTKAKNRLFVEK